MAIPHGITADHVQLAMSQIVAQGVPSGSASTRYDVVDPATGTLLPPKLVLAVSAEIATGVALSRKEFSGGEQTNSVLKELGFQIVTKNGPSGPMSISDIKPGDVLTNDQIVHAFKVGNAGGMRWSSENDCLVIIADHTKSLYDDRWDGDVLSYTGMGRIGDQALTGQNLRLSRQNQTGVSVHLFEVFTQNAYYYAGQVDLVAPVRDERQPDENGNDRRVYIFPLRLAHGAVRPTPHVQELQRITRERGRSLSKLPIEELAQRASAGGSAIPSRREAITTQYVRNEAVAALAKKLAAGTCDLCSQPAPFVTSDGPYLECHHVAHLAQGGPDVIENTVALCANCHRRMHALDREEDRHKLRGRIARRGALASFQPT